MLQHERRKMLQIDSDFLNSIKDDEVLKLIKLIRMRKSQKIDNLVIASSGRPKCPVCGKEMVKNGLTSEKRQKWICKDIHVSSSSNTNKITYRTKLKAAY